MGICIYAVVPQAFSHDVDIVSYVTVEIIENNLHFINPVPEGVASHIFYAGYEEYVDTFHDFLTVSNAGALCPLKDFAVHEENAVSKEPYMLTAYCEFPISELVIEDSFPIESDMDKVYTIRHQDQRLSMSGEMNFITTIVFQEGTMVLLEESHTSPNVQSDTQSNDTSTTNTVSQAREISPLQNNIRLFGAYTKLGLEHILSGLDHILFILGFILLAHSFFGLLKGITGFTVSHSITLTLAALSILTLPPSIVEPLIALSISIVGILALLNIAKQWLLRFGIIFLFGLFHGLGFAGSIEEVGFPNDGFVAALLGFNIGIELGQLLIVFAVFPLLNKLEQSSEKHYLLVTRILSIVIILCGFIWFIQRIILLF